MDFTIREENVRLLSSSIGEIEKRFNTTVTVEETTYAPSAKHTLRWVQLRGKDEQLTKCAKVRIWSFLEKVKQKKNPLASFFESLFSSLTFCLLECTHLE